VYIVANHTSKHTR